MRNLFCGALAAAMLYFAVTVQAQTPSQSKTTPPKTAPAKKAVVPAAGKSTPAKTAAKTAPRPTVTAKNGKKAPAKRASAPAQTWRNRQMAPTPDRYKEIQEALAAKGYLKPEDATGTWGQSSVEAMQKFQADQKLDGSGKINSLSLIALGLGPKHNDPASPAAPPSPPEVR